MTSPRSTMAEAPNTRIGPHPWSRDGFDRIGDRFHIVGAARDLAQSAAERHQPRVDRLNALVEDLGLGLRQFGQHQTDVVRFERHHPDRCLRTAQGDRTVEHGLGHGEGNDLHRRQHLSRLDHLKAGRRRDGEALVDPVDRVDGRHIDQGQAVRIGIDIGAAGKGFGDHRMRAAHRLCESRRRLVLRHVARLEPGRHHLCQAGFGQLSDVVGTEQPPFLEDAACMPHGMGEHSPFGLIQRHHAEFHFAPPAPCLRAPVTSAMIDMAISGAPRAPILRPMGPWMRSSLSPLAASRSSRAAWVLRLPSAPI